MPHHPGATYLLSDGRTATGEHPICYQTHAEYQRTPLLPGRDNDGLWAEVPDEDPGDLDAGRVVAWLSPEGEDLLRVAGGLHAFRGAIRTRYPDAQIIRYRRGNGTVAREHVMILEGE